MVDQILKYTSQIFYLYQLFHLFDLIIHLIILIWLAIWNYQESNYYSWIYNIYKINTFVSAIDKDSWVGLRVEVHFMMVQELRLFMDIMCVMICLTIFAFWYIYMFIINDKMHRQFIIIIKWKLKVIF